jgi:hypothetical protein
MNERNRKGGERLWAVNPWGDGPHPRHHQLDVLALLADLDEISLAVSDFEELHIATVLNRPGENATI